MTHAGVLPAPKVQAGRNFEQACQDLEKLKVLYPDTSSCHAYPLVFARGRVKRLKARVELPGASPGGFRGLFRA